MNAETFAASLAATGFTNIETRDFTPRPPNGEHSHDWRTMGLVLAGEFVVVTVEGRLVCKAGDTFDVAAGVPHHEEIGADGARVLIGRKLA